MNINIFDKVKLKDMEWMKDAACAGRTDVDFHPVKSGGVYMKAKRICDTCLVKSECLEYAIKYNEDLGIWGGMGPRARTKIKLARRNQS